jgi:hypothetical protein
MKNLPLNAWRLVAFMLSGLAAAACGSSGADTGVGSNAAACVANELTLAGELDGQPVAVQLDTTSSVFQQLSTPATLDVGYADGAVHLQWNNLLPIGQTTAATGTIVMPAGSPHAGETICAGSGSITDQSATDGAVIDNYLFTLRTLSTGPTCPGTALTGSIDGCKGG